MVQHRVPVSFICFSLQQGHIFEPVLSWLCFFTLLLFDIQPFITALFCLLSDKNMMLPCVWIFVLIVQCILYDMMSITVCMMASLLLKMIGGCDLSRLCTKNGQKVMHYILILR